MSPVTNRGWPKGYRSGHCISEHHFRCKGGVWGPSGYTPCACSCRHPHIFNENDEEEFLNQEYDPSVVFIDPDEEIGVVDDPTQGWELAVDDPFVY